MSSKAFVNIKSGSLDAANFEMKSVDVPSASGRHVVVKQAAAAVNPVDTKVFLYGADFSTKAGTDVSLVGGYDGCGKVVAVGDKVENFKVGDSVYYAGNLGHAGSFAEHTAVDERIVGKAPAKLESKWAATVPLTALTAWESLVERAGMDATATDANAAKNVLIINGAGGVGSVAIQLAKKVFGAGNVVATASRDATVAWCKRMGADAVINHREAFKAQVDALALPGGGFDVVLCLVDLELHFADNILPVLNPLGSLVTITGNYAGLDFSPMFFKSQRIAFEVMYTKIIFDKQAASQGRILTRVGELLDDGTLTHWGNDEQVFKFTAEDLKKALDLQASGKAIGKIAITF